MRGTAQRRLHPRLPQPPQWKRGRELDPLLLGGEGTDLLVLDRRGRQAVQADPACTELTGQVASKGDHSRLRRGIRSAGPRRPAGRRRGHVMLAPDPRSTIAGRKARAARRWPTGRRNDLVPVSRGFLHRGYRRSVAPRESRDHIAVRAVPRPIGLTRRVRLECAVGSEGNRLSPRGYLRRYRIQRRLVMRTKSDVCAVSRERARRRRLNAREAPVNRRPCHRGRGTWVSVFE